MVRPVPAPEPVLTKFARDQPRVAVAKIDATKRMTRVRRRTARTPILLRFRRSGSTDFNDLMGREMKRVFAISGAFTKPPSRGSKYDEGAGETHINRASPSADPPFDENLKEFEGVANDLAHMASFALVEDHRNTGLYPGKVGCVSVNASAHRFPGGDLRVSSSVFARLRSRRRDGVETCSRPRGRAAAAPPTRDPHRRTGSRSTTRSSCRNSGRTTSGGSA